MDSYLVAFVFLEITGVVPVVAHLVIVPEHDLGHLGVESPHVLVEQVVFVVAAELVQRLGDFRFGLGDDVLPHRAVVQFDLRGHVLVGVDGVAAVDEDIRFGAAHRVVELEAAPL